MKNRFKPQINTDEHRWKPCLSVFICVHLWPILLFAVPVAAMAAINGTVVNRTTGKPQAGADVSLLSMAQGMQPVASVKSGAGGKFSIPQDLQGPGLLQATHDGITYNKMLQPGAPTTGIELDVFDGSKKPGDAKITQHMMLFEPGDGQLNVTEIYMFQNQGRTTFNNPEAGTLQFYVPAAAKGVVKVSATAPHGMPLDREAERVAGGDVWKVDFPIKPGGETRIDVSYLVPYQAGAAYEAKLVSKQGTLRLFTPAGVTMTGDGIKPAGTEPTTNANVYEVTGSTLKVAFNGTGSMRAQNDAGADSQDNGPTIEQIMPKLYGNAPLIVALALGILALGFVILYRAQPAAAVKETNERRRR